MTYLTQQVRLLDTAPQLLIQKHQNQYFLLIQMTLLKVGVDPNTPVRQVRSALRHFRPKAGKNELYGFPVCLCARIEVCLCVCSVHACVCSCAMCITCLLRRNLSLAAVRSSWKFEREQAQCHQLEAKDHTEYSKVRLERSLACRGQLPLLSACPLQLSGWSN